MKSTLFFLILGTCLASYFVSNVEAQTPYIWGVAYGVDNLNCPSYAQIEADLTQIKTYTNRVRVYSCFYCNNICYNVTKATQKLGLELLIGLQPAPANEWAWELLMLQQIQDTLGFGGVVGITVGSETLFRKDMTSTELAKVITDTRTFVRVNLGLNLPVGSVDIHNQFDDILINVCDEIYINSFPYWIGIQDIDVALQAMFDHYDVTVKKVKGKKVIFGEMGWPTMGHNVGEAQATPERLQAFLKPFACEAKFRNIGYYWFSAYDRNSQAQDTESHWGLFTSDRVRKPAFQVFNCDDYVSKVITPGDKTKPADWKNSQTHDKNYDGQEIVSSNANPRTYTSEVIPSTSTSTSSSTPSSTSASSSAAATSSQVVVGSSTPVVPPSSTNSGIVDDGPTDTGLGRDQTGQGMTLVASSLLLFVSLFLLM